MLDQLEYEVTQEYIENFFQEDRGIEPGNIVDNLIRLLKRLQLYIRNIDAIEDPCKKTLCNWIAIKIQDLIIIKPNLR
jgi:hypothetical protein